MGTVMKAGPKNYMIRYDDYSSGTRKRPQIGGFASREEAQTALEEIENGLDKSKSGKNITVSELAEIFDRLHIASKAEGTQYTYRLAIKSIKEYLGEEKRVRDITKMDGREYVAAMSKVMKPNTARLRYATLLKLMNFAVEYEYIPYNPLAGSRIRPQEVQWDGVYWNAQEIQKYLPVMKTSFLHYYAQVGILTGLRVSEICGISEDCIDFDNHLLHITKQAKTTTSKQIEITTTKNKKIRTLEMTAELEAIFKARILEIKKQSLKCENYDETWKGYLSVNSKGHLMTGYYISKKWQEFMNKHPEIKRMGIHGLRHSCAAWLISNGVDLKTIQDLFGHDSIDTTAKFYAHLDSAHRRKALNTLTLIPSPKKKKSPA